MHAIAEHFNSKLREGMALHTFWFFAQVSRITKLFGQILWNGDRKSPAKILQGRFDGLLLGIGAAIIIDGSKN